MLDSWCTGRKYLSRNHCFTNRIRFPWFYTSNMCSSKDREEPRKAFLIAFLPQIYLLMTGILAVSLCLVELCWNECTNLLEPGAPVKTVMSFRPYGLLATLWPNKMSSTGWEILDKLPNIRRRPSVSSLAVNNIYVYSHIWSIVLVVAIENWYGDQHTIITRYYN